MEWGKWKYFDNTKSSHSSILLYSKGRFLSQ